MGSSNLYKGFEEEAKFWLNELEKYNDVPFTTQSPDDDWTMSKVYSYLALSVEQYCRNIEDAINNGSKTSKGNKTLLGATVFIQKKLTNYSLKK